MAYRVSFCKLKKNFCKTISISTSVNIVSKSKEESQGDKQQNRLK